MRTIGRPCGRFFAVLIVWLACVAPQAVVADGAGFWPPSEAPSAWGGKQWPVGRLSGNQVLAAALTRPHAFFGALKLTQITDTVYYANGAKAQGTLIISWPAFTTAGQNVVAAGSLTVQLGPDGLFNAALAPTTGSTPAGVYYTVVYQLGDGSNKQEYWAVPATDNTNIAAVRAKLVPTTQAAQFMTRDLADSSYVHLNDDQTVGGVKTFSKPPVAPDPQKPTDVANKEYVDANAGTANLDSPPPIGGVKPNAGTFSTLTASATNSVLNAAQFMGSGDIGAGVNAAFATLPVNAFASHAGKVVVPTGTYFYSTPIVIHSPYVTLDFQGSVLVYGGSGVGITYGDAPTSYGGNGGIRNLELHGSASGAIGILINEVTFNVFYNVNVKDFTAGKGIVVSNTQLWTENNEFTHIRGANNAVGMEFEDNCAGHTGCPSFAYSRFEDVEMSAPAGGTAFNFLNDSDPGGSSMSLKCFLGQGATCVHLQGTSGLKNLPWFYVVGEVSGGTSATGIATDAGTTLQGQYYWHWYNGTITDSLLGTTIAYLYNTPGFGQIFAYPYGLGIGSTSNHWLASLDARYITNYRDLVIPDNSGTIVLADCAGDNCSNGAIKASSVKVSGDLTARDIPGHAYFVSQYPSIQAAINAAYGSGTVSGEVIDDRTAPYSGPGFYIPDSVTVRLAPLPYSFTSAVTHNNGNNNVTAAIIVEQGAHLSGGGTSSNHGTTISVGTGFANDILATTSVGTGIGASVQWWHWGAIENLNVDGANQTSGECVHVENMGETSRVRDLLVKNCYGNNIEFVGAAATQSDIANLTSNRSRTGSGVRFTNLAGLGKINGLSGDCNAGSLVSVQENAAGTLVITGLKSEAESTICSNGTAHDPVVLLDTLMGLNTHVHIVGGYAFGTAQNAVAKIIGSGGGILEMEGFYSTGYTNLLNDTIRSVVVPATSSNSKQPFYYEPNGIVFANQAFTLTPGTGVMGGSTSLTPIFYATTGNATMVASLGNGDGQSIMTGGVELAGQNRTMYGATPELMARAGYRFTGSGYDTTKWDFVPAWNAGDTTEKNLGNSLTVCQKNGSVSCRWNHIYGVNDDVLVFTLGTYTVATLPTGYGAGSMTWVSDGASAADCTAGHGSTRVLCYYTGSAWTALTTGGGSGSWGSITGTLSNQTDLQTALNNKAASNASTTVNGVPCALGSSCAPGVHLVGGTMVGPQSGIVGNGADQNVFSVSIPANTAVVGGGLKCYARFTKLSTSNSITFKWVLGSTTLATQSVTSGSTNWTGDLEIFTPASLSSEVVNASALLAGTAIQAGPQVGLTASENLANAATLKLTFNASSAETITPKMYYCETVQ